ncbi:MAG: hypothetical protein EAZ95_04820 [Bacteroidetes bacterium]|nr:MAG: hypothetical protein EAZ95_04820 [Bacteroidota bacterium]
MLPKIVPITHNQEHGVFINSAEWENFLKQHQMLEHLFEWRNGLKEAFQEIRDIQAGKTDYITMEDFLNEC